MWQVITETLFDNCEHNLDLTLDNVKGYRPKIKKRTYQNRCHQASSALMGIAARTLMRGYSLKMLGCDMPSGVIPMF